MPACQLQQPFDGRWRPGEDGPVIEKAFEIFGQVTGREVTVIAFFGASLQDNGFQLGGDGWVETAWRDGVVGGDLGQEAVAVFAIENGLQGEQFVECGTQGVDIGPVVDHAWAG